MCEFISWVERRDKVYFLTGEQLFNTKKGQELLKTISLDDLCGHGTIRAYYGIDSQDGIDRECADFSTPDNFPPQIVAAIKSGKMRGIGIALGLLTATSWKAYEKAKATSWKAYEEAIAPSWKAYEEAKAPSWKAYEEAKATSWKAYEEAKATVFWDLFAVQENRVKAWRD